MTTRTHFRCPSLAPSSGPPSSHGVAKACPGCDYLRCCSALASQLASEELAESAVSVMDVSEEMYNVLKAAADALRWK